MALFPTTIGIGYGTDLVPQTNRKATIMRNGESVIHEESANVWFRGTIECVHITAAQWTEIQTFYNTNKNLEWTFDNPQDGITYTLKFLNRPHPKREKNNDTVLYRVTLSVIGVQ